MYRTIGILRGGRRLFSWPAGLVAACILGTIACEGDNLFPRDPTDPTLDVEDTEPPEIEIIEPLEDGTYPLDDAIPVTARARDIYSGLAAVEFAAYAQGDVSQGEPLWIERYEPVAVQFTVPVDSTELSRSLEPLAGERVVGEHVYVRVRAIDMAGNVDSAHVRVSVGGPHVEILDLEDQVYWPLDEEIQIRVAAQDPTELGIDTVWLNMSGAFELDTAFPISPSSVSTTVTWQGNFTGIGRVTISASARNRVGAIGRTPRTVTVDVIETELPDTIPPQVALELEAGQRMEYSDQVVLRVTANDLPSAGAGLERVGYVAYATITHEGMEIDQQLANDTDFGGSKEQKVFSDTVSIAEIYAVADLDPDTLSLPGNVHLEVFAFARDTVGNCQVATPQGMYDCSQVTIGGETYFVADGAVGAVHELDVVAGRTVSLPDGGVVADAAVDTVHGRMYLSNTTLNRVETLDLNTFRFMDFASVGSEPWGLFIADDQLLVANSGGTNIDQIDLDANPLSQSTSTRLYTPNVVLWQVNVERDDAGAVTFTTDWFDFSDKPQFVAKDSVGNILYSTVPTGTAPDGTIRVARFQPGWAAPAVEMLLPGNVHRPSADSYSIWNVDVVSPCTYTDGVFLMRGIRILDHQVGFPDNRMESECLPPPSAMEDIRAQGSNIEWVEAAAWNLDAIGLSDTTFVAASGDRGRIVFGEGAAEPAGRIMVWRAEDASVSNAIQVTDLIHNEPARIVGVDLNHDGKLGIARGQAGAYFFDEDLRLQGRFVEEMAGGAGAALHPEHTGVAPPADVRMSFVGTAALSVKVIDSHHFLQLAEIPVRDPIIGPLRAIRVPGQALPPTDPDYIVTRLFGVTMLPNGERAVVTVNVRRRDLP